MKGKKETKERKSRKGKKGKNGKEKEEKGKKGKNWKTQKRQGKSGFRKSVKQNVPATCTADKCEDKDYVNLFNAYKKNDNLLRQLQRLVRFYELLRKKASSALTTFQPAAVGNCTLLQNCSVTAANICSTI